MADVHNGLKRAPWAKAYAAIVGATREPDVDIERISETLQGVLDPIFYPDSFIQAGWLLAQATRTAVATPAIMSAVQLFNPASSGVLAVVTRVDVSSDVVAQFSLRTNDTQRAGGTAGSARDRRFPPGVSGAGATRLVAVGDVTAAAVGGIAAIWGPRALANTNVVFDQPIILPPGAGIDLVTGVVNQFVTGSFSWWERSLIPGD